MQLCQYIKRTRSIIWHFLKTVMNVNYVSYSFIQEEKMLYEICAIFIGEKLLLE